MSSTIQICTLDAARDGDLSVYDGRGPISDWEAEGQGGSEKPCITPHKRHREVVSNGCVLRSIITSVFFCFFRFSDRYIVQIN